MQRDTALTEGSAIIVRRGESGVELNRHHYFIVGIVVLLLGVQLRMVESFLLNAPTTKWLMEQSDDPTIQAVNAANNVMPAVGPQPKKRIVPPEWLGYAALSVGSVLVLHALALPRPAG